MKVGLAFFLIICVGCSMRADAGTILIRGTVIELFTKEPLPGSHILVGNKSYSSKLDGSFEIRLQENEMSDSMVIHYLGFHDFILKGIRHLGDTIQIGSIPLIENHNRIGGCIFCGKWDLICRWKTRTRWGLNAAKRKDAKRTREYLTQLEEATKDIQVQINGQWYPLQYSPALILSIDTRL